MNLKLVQLIFCWFFPFNLPFSVIPSTNSADIDDKALVESPFLPKSVHVPDGMTVLFTPILLH